MPSLPLFPGVPGGPELFIVLLVFVVPLAFLLVGGAAVVGFLRRRSSDDRVRELERHVEELEREKRE
ncbi:preprotein translocase subunit TatA [Halomarina halobia]|uniref:Preprotein translocase subunit TatA n=1 Tax=Halomarina halobia TaxID=3033386 RepID=A0ABD6AAZ6_9EURY|nr:preprotein translocase subunit TatA [Halomarina sp. PSR21]